MKKLVFILIGVLGVFNSAVAQKVMEQGHEDMAFNKPHALVANTIVWVSVAIVILTLYITLKYIFFPGEKDPDHIKNIVKDEYFE